MTDHYASAPPGYQHPTERGTIWKYHIQQPPAPASRDWPRALHGAFGEHRIVHNQADMDDAVAAGWNVEPMPLAAQPKEPTGPEPGQTPRADPDKKPKTDPPPPEVK